MSDQKPSVLHVVDTLTTGGAEIFVMRLSQAMTEAGWPVSIFVSRPDRIEREQLARLAPGVKVFAAQIPLLPWLMRLDGLLMTLGFSFSLLRWWQSRSLVKHVRDHRVGLLHSHLMTADLVACAASRQTGVPWMSTMHGDYFKFAQYRRYKPSRIFDFSTHFAQVDQQVAHVVCISEPQMAQWAALSVAVFAQGRISKIYNGYTPLPGSSRNVDEALAPIPEDAFVIGMVARGAREKGWEVMLHAFERLSDPRAWLVLVGDGDYIRELRSNVNNPRVIFAGNVTNPANWIARFDVGCLPTLYDSESLPNSVIEYLFEGKPVVATDVGEIATMIQAGAEDKAAGLTIAFDSVEAMSQQLARALQTLLVEPALYDKMAANARMAANAFKMQHCLAQYFNLYSKLHESK